MALAKKTVTGLPRSLFKGYSWRRVKESLTAYLFLFPAFLIIGTFGLFPMVFSVYVSLHKWRIIPGNYVGLSHYVKAIDSLAYLLFFWLGVLFAYLLVKNILDVQEKAKERGEQPWAWLLPSLVSAAGIGLFLRFAFTLLPGILDIGEQVKGMHRTQDLFNRLLLEAWGAASVQAAFRTALIVLIAGTVLAYLVNRYVMRSSQNATYYTTFIFVFALLAGAVLLEWLTWTEIQNAYAQALENGETLEIWSQMVTISTGFVLLFFAWRLWGSASKQNSTLGMVFRISAAIALMIGAWVLIGELPRVISAGYDDWWEGLQATVYYSFFTVPLQLTISLFLATLLFQELKGKSLFRLIYFLPYVTNPVAAASIFKMLFSSRVSAPVNNLITFLGGKPLMWLDEPARIFQMLLPGVELPNLLAGPSLALMVIIIYNIWTFIGYDTVIFLAGLGGIPSSLYEAASVDGAGRWAQFRHITVPLLSPTTYYLTLIAVIGTFKAFTHVWVLRSGAALGTTDTASIKIFVEFSRNTRYGYASALALILMAVVLALTVVNNRIASKKVFYG